ncbi:hypothetical protein C8Q70DRAFT_1049478 [Cubamyces menziesii]|uniref:Transmembrane protein n=1 Tax=Trametes cubensis TaxID=1111947 RepID=A0AAD7XE68_9APHY|nr:hypothetical protein C8Q70DRAFT_1049478 [Cubamyces menziesii]KAJ8494685.1 hypothetical protein ONZ51_g2166 [Trametes cubensis]
MSSKSRAFASVIPAAQHPPATPEDAMKQALLAVVQVWLDRLQSMAVITTFFVSVDSLLFSLTSATRKSDLSAWSGKDKVINASIGGSIIFHVCASIVAYIGSFVLIRYRLNSAEQTEQSTVGRWSTSSAGDTYTQKRPMHPTSPHRSAAKEASAATAASPMDTMRDFPMEVFTDLRSLVNVDRANPFWFLPCATYRRAKQKQDPEASLKDSAVASLENIVDVLARAHTVCAIMGSLGFLLALLGILTYSWTAVPTSLAIFASACMGVCGLAALVAFW